MAKTNSIQKKIEAEKMVTKMEKHLQVNKQCCMWKNNGKLKKQRWCKACKEQKRLFKMETQTKLYVTQNIW